MMLNIIDPTEVCQIGKFTYTFSTENDEFDIPCYIFRAELDGIIKSTIKIYREFNDNKLICIHYWMVKNTASIKQRNILKSDFTTMNLRSVLEALIRRDQLEII